MNPSDVVTLAHFWRQFFVSQADPSPLTPGLQLNLDNRGARRDRATDPLPAPGEHHLAVRYNFQICPSNYATAVPINTVYPTGPGLDLCRNTHPAQHLHRISEQLENDARGRINVDFLDQRVRCHRFFPSSSAAVFRRFKLSSQKESRKTRNCANPSRRSRYNLLVPCRRRDSSPASFSTRRC